jgi:hypothetical protein
MLKNKLWSLHGQCGKPIRGKSYGLLSSPGGFKKGSVKIRFPMHASLAVCLAVTGCSFAGHGKQHSGVAKPQSSPAAAKTRGLASWIPFLLKPLPPPPKASILLETGTIRQVSADGSYAIIELTPGVLVSPGEILIAPSADHSLARVKVTEVQPPCFAVEIIEGSVTTGDRVKR